MDKIIKAARPEEVAAAQAAADNSKGAAAKAAPRFLSGIGVTAVVPLLEPFEYDGVEYCEITVNRLFGRDFSRIAEVQRNCPDADANEITLAVMTKLDLELLRGLAFEDYTEVLRQAEGFMPEAAKILARQAMVAGSSANGDGSSTDSPNSQDS